MKQPILVDSHAHLEMRQFAGDLESVLERAHAAGVAHIITVGSTLAESRRAVKIAHRYPEVSAVVGIHPHDASLADDAAMAELGKLTRRDSVVAVGETGLDFFRDRSPRPAQEEAFRQHIHLARTADLPLVIHVRDAYPRALQILDEAGIPPKGAVVHCFSGTAADAEAFLSRGLFLSFTGTVTYEGRKNQEWAQEVLSRVPLERIMVETDCPYLAPHPFRGQRCEPAHVTLVARKLAEVKGLSEVDVARMTTRNAVRFYNLPLQLPHPSVAYTIRDSVYLNVTSRCTSSCTFCQRTENPVVKGHDLRLERDPTVQEMKDALEEEGWRRRSEVVFCGYGEPTLRLKEVLEVARILRAERPGVRLRLNTNGLGSLSAGRDIVPDLVGAVDTVSVSLNAQDEATYLSLCRPSFGPGSHRAVLDFARACVRSGLNTVLTVVDHPGVDVKRCRQIAVGMGAGFRVRPLNEVG